MRIPDLLALLVLFTAACSGGSSTPQAGPVEESAGYPAYERYLAAVSAGDGPGAVRELEAAIESDPAQPVFYTNFGGILGQQGKLVAAKRKLEQGIEACGETPGLLYNLGIISYKLQDLAAAETALRRVIELDPTASLAHHNLGLVYWRMANVVVGAQNIDRQRAKSALDSFAKAIELQPDGVEPHYWSGLVHRELEEDKQAYAFLKKAVELDPTNTRSILEAAETAHKLTHFKQARDLYDSVLAIDPESAKAHYGLGRGAARNNNWERALECYGKAVEYEPNLAAAHYGLSTAYRRLDRPEDAEKALEDFQRVNAENQQAYNADLDASTHQVTAEEYYELGVHAESKDDALRAIDSYRKAVAIDARMAKAHVRLGRLLTDTGDLANAHDHLKYALELDPRNAKVREYLTEVRTLITNSPEFDELINKDGEDGSN